MKQAAAAAQQQQQLMQQALLLQQQQQQPPVFPGHHGLLAAPQVRDKTSPPRFLVPSLFPARSTRYCGGPGGGGIDWGLGFGRVVSAI